MKRTLTRRLTAKLKALPVDPNNGVRVDFKTSRCLRAYAYHHGWKIVQAQSGPDHVIVWRVG